jgi:hypothetical protein
LFPYLAGLETLFKENSRFLRSAPVKRVAGMRTRRLTRGHLRLIRFAHPLWLTSFLALATVFASHRAAGQPSVLTQHNDNARTGQNTNETLLNTSNVNVNDFGLVFSLPVQGQVYAQPLYVPNVTINGTTHNVLIVATEQEYVYAFDADAPAAPLWTASLVDTLHGANPDETAVLGLTELGCKDLQPYVGITSTPAIDPVAGAIYVEAKSTDGTNYFHRLHALDLTTGAEKSQGPAVITATVAGTGDGSTNGQLIFDSFHELNRPGLLLLNGTIYVGFASHCDFSPYHGWLFAYDAATLAQQSVLLTTPNGGMGGFWQSGAGIATDPTGNIYISSGNGTFDTANVPPTELGDTLMKLGTAGGQLSLKDYFTPSDEGCLSTKDLDLGSGGVLVLPEQPGANPHILVAAGKEGAIYVVNRDQLTAGNAHFENSNDCTTDDPEILGESGPGAIGRMFGLPAYWNNTLYFMGAYHVMRSIPIVNGLPNFSQITNNTTTIPYPGATPSVSSNGTTAGSAILWVLDTSQYGPPSATPPGPAVLHAFDATNINTELWNSTQAPNNRDAAGNAVKFAVPTVVSGKVFIGTTNFVNVYGVFNVITFPALPNVTYGASPIKLTAAASSGLAVTYTVTGPAMVSGSTLTITGAGTVNVTASQVGNRDYVAAAPVSQSFTVAQAPLTVTASNFAVPYGQTIPAPTGYIAIGFVNGDTSAVLSGAPAESTTATQGSNAGQLLSHVRQRNSDHLGRGGPDDHLPGTAQPDLRNESDRVGGDGKLGPRSDLHGDRPGQVVRIDADHHRSWCGHGDSFSRGQHRLCDGYTGIAELHGGQSHTDGDGGQFRKDLRCGPPALQLHHHWLPQRGYVCGGIGSPQGDDDGYHLLSAGHLPNQLPDRAAVGDQLHIQLCERHTDSQTGFAWCEG